jgi:hypothetical protein
MLSTMYGSFKHGMIKKTPAVGLLDFNIKLHRKNSSGSLIGLGHLIT